MDIVDPRVDPSLVPPGSRAIIVAKDQPQYRDLPSVRTPLGHVITRWTLTDEERRRIAEGEDIFVTLLAFGAINPFYVTVGAVNWAADQVQES